MMKCERMSGCCRTWLETTGVEWASRLGLGAFGLNLVSFAGAVLVPLGFACHPFWGLFFLVFSVAAGALSEIVREQEGRAPGSALGRTLLCRGIEYLYLVGFWMAFWSRDQWTVQASLLVFASMVLLGFLGQVQTRFGEACGVWLSDVRTRVHYYMIWAFLLVLIPWAREGVLWVGMMLYFVFLLLSVVRCVLASDNGADHL